MNRKLSAILLAMVFTLTAVIYVPASTVFADGTQSVREEVEKEFATEDLTCITRADYCKEIVILYQDLVELTTGQEAQDLLGLTQNPFSDTDDEYVLKAYALGIVSGNGDGTFDPDDELTLEEKAVMLCNTLKLIDPDFEKEVGRELDCEDEDQISSWAVDA
ncbi:MAG: S-layer homology domain-containing protein, partial [Eubacteriales bacterium]|nr:S-layer homology domain-containing protein [Eubacteriales bacterium]